MRIPLGSGAVALAVVAVLTVALLACARPFGSPPLDRSTPGTTTLESTDGDLARVVAGPPMRHPRAVHAATRLQDGRILVVGGCPDPGCEIGRPDGATAEVFDPAVGAWVETGRLATSRDDFATALLPDGRVLVAGGWTGDRVTDSTEVYDPGTGRWSAGPQMSTPRAGFPAVVLPDGRVLLAGGFLDNRPTTELADLFDPATDAIRPTGPLGVPRGSHAAVGTRDGRVLVAGGLSGGTVVASAEAWEPATGRFAPTGPMETARYKGAAWLDARGRVVVAAGSGDIDGSILFDTTEAWDPATGTFAPGPMLADARYKLVTGVVPLDSGVVVVTGGASTAEVLDPLGDAFRLAAGRLDATRLYPAAAAIDERTVLVTGGYDDRIRPTAATWLVELGTATSRR